MLRGVFGVYLCCFNLGWLLCIGLDLELFNDFVLFWCVVYVLFGCVCWRCDLFDCTFNSVD